MTGPEGQIAQITRGLASIMAKRAALVAEIGVPAVTPTPRQAIPAPPEALNPTPPMGTVISIAPPPSRYQPVPVPPTGTAISIAPPPLRTSGTGPTNGHRNIYCPAPSQCPPLPVLPAGTAAPIAPPHPQYRPAATSPTAAQARLPASSGANAPTASVPRVVHQSNYPPPSAHEPPSIAITVSGSTPQPPSIPNNANVRLGSAQQVATRTRVNRAPSAPIDVSMVNTTPRLHQRRHTRPYRIPLKMLAGTIPQESLTPLTRPTLFTPPTPPDLPSTLTTRPLAPLFKRLA